MNPDTTDHNPYLASNNQRAEGPAKGSIDAPGQLPNIIWQTRPAPPTPFENALGDALEQVFEAGATELPDVVAGLNANGCMDPDGKPWTPTRLTEVLAKVGHA